MSDASQISVYAIVLAAGAATRFGSTKQLAEYRSTALVRHATDLASNCCGARNVLVVGHDWRAVAAACQPLNGFLIVNEQHAVGMGSSIAMAVNRLRHVADAVVVLLADQPLVGQRHVDALIAAWTGDCSEIVATAYAGTRGAPALFANGCFEQLGQLKGDQGARALFDNAAFTVRSVTCENALADVDTSDDLLRLARNARS